MSDKEEVIQISFKVTDKGTIKDFEMMTMAMPDTMLIALAMAQAAVIKSANLDQKKSITKIADQLIDMMEGTVSMSNVNLNDVKGQA